MNDSADSGIPWILWPFFAIWKILTLILNITGRIICALIGIAMMVAGVAVSMSIVGAVIGIPLASFGFLLSVRALF